MGLEFYERLAAEEQHETAYWPKEIDHTKSGGRKRTHPTDFVRPENSLPKYLWLGVTCSHRYEEPMKAWENDIKQLECHLVYLAAQSRKLTSFGTRAWRKLHGKGKTLAEGTFDELLPIAVGALIDTFPGIGAVKKIVISITGAALQSVKDKQEIARATVLAIPPDYNEVKRVVKYLATISKDNLPIVILIEDIHLADDMLFDFVDGLMEHGGGVLIISTVWPEKIVDVPRLTELFGRYGHRIHHVTDAEPAPVPPFAGGAGLMELERNAREEILEDYYEHGVDEATASMLLDRYVNPLMLETFCQLPSYLDRFSDRKLILTPNEVERLPKRLDELYEELWRQMSLADKAALAVAWYISPENINPAEAPGVREWSHSILRDVMASLTLYRRRGDDQHEIVAALDANARPGAWIRAVNEYLRAYMEPLQRQIIGENSQQWLHDELLGDAREKILQALAACLTNTADDETASTKEVRVIRARSILALYRESDRESYIANPQLVAEAIDTLLGDLAETSKDFGERDKLWNVYLELNSKQVSDGVQFAVRRKRAAKLAEDYLSLAALEMYSRLVEDMSRTEGFGRRHKETLEIRYEILVHQSDLGGFDENTIEELARDMRRVYGLDNPDALDMELRRCRLAGDIDIYRDLLDRRLEMEGGINKEVADAMNGLIGLVWNSRDYNGAIEECEMLLPQVEAALGKAHPIAFKMRTQRAHLLNIAGDHPAAVEATRLLVSDQKQDLGSEHPDVLRSRVEYARSLMEANERKDALDECNAVVSDTERILGTDHPIYRWAEETRISVMLLHKEYGPAADASERHFLRVLESPGADDAKGMEARNWHVHNLWTAGRHGKAITLQEEAMELESRVYGWKHGRLYVMRHEYVELLNDAGRHDRALAESRRLLKDAQGQAREAQARYRLQPWIVEMVSEQQIRLESEQQERLESAE